MRRLILLTCLTAVASSATPAMAQTVTELYVRPDTVRLAPGTRQALSVQAFDDAGNAVLSFSFRSSDTSVAQVASNGVVTAGRGGRAQVTVTAGNKSQVIPVTVSGGAETVAAAPAGKPAAPKPRPSAPKAPAKPVVSRLVAEPASLTLFPGQRMPVTVRAFDAGGTLIDAPELVWRSMQPSLIRVDETAGEVTALAAGAGVVQVIGGNGISVSIPITISSAEYRLSADRLVLGPQERDSLVATLPLQGNRPVPPGVLQWSAADPGVIDVGSTGEITAIAPGATEVVIRGFAQERRIPVTVHGKVSHFTVAPRIDQPVRLMLNATREFTAIPQTVDSIPIEGVPMRWSLSDSTVASFDPATGTLTARKGGSTFLSFAVKGFQPKSWTVEVIPGEVAFAAARATLRPGEEMQLKPNFVGPAGNIVAPATGLGWGTSDANIVKITPSGLITGVAPGRATITATAAGGKPDSMTVVVTGDLLVASSRGGSFGIYALTTAAPEQFHPVVADAGNNVDPAYSPDRSRLAFASDRGGSLDLYVADADGRNLVRLTSDPSPESEPAWTPDGSRLVFAATRAGSRQLYVISANGGEARQLTSLPGGASEPVVSPDGHTVAFTGSLSTNRDAPTDIYTIPIQGGTPTPITQSRDRRERMPAYLPDGTLTWTQLRKDRKDPDQVVQQPKIGGVSATLLTTPLPLQSVAVSRDGSRIAWVVSQAPENSKAAPEVTLRWRTLSGGNESSVRLQPGERITSPAF
ncbi:MAG TPA: Ig-like domain-containing protein [Gemmatimonadales bacterium]|nr:Ig-like domain-containing protein [Gemmatimonadales bacterium]